MNKIYRVIIGSFFVSIVLLSLATGQARALDSRCNPAVWDILETNAQASVVQDQALTYELTKQNDSTLGMTCFDQALRSTAKAGAIFSDTPLSGGFSPLALTTAVITAGLSKFTGVQVTSGPNAGNRGSTLVDDLNNTISGTMSTLLNSFTASVTTAVTSFISGAVAGVLGGIIGSIGGLLLGDLMGGFFAAGLGLDANPFDCPLMSLSWTGGTFMGNPVGGTVGIGLSGATPYTSYDERYSYAKLATPITGLAGEFQDRLDGANTILTKAYDDINTSLAPGGINPNVPGGVGVNSSLATVLGAM